MMCRNFEFDDSSQHGSDGEKDVASLVFMVLSGGQQFRECTLLERTREMKEDWGEIDI